MEERKEINNQIKKILFLSADDFKEKSIQVIRKTPEAYLAAGWEVHYIVVRDSSNKGNYYYERIINIDGIHIQRIEAPGTPILNWLQNRYLVTLFIRVRRYLGIIYLILEGIKQLKKHNFDILYGYEQPGATAAKFINSLGFAKNTKLVLRFQGVVFVKEWIHNKLWFRRVANFDTFYALKGPSDLCIMTNDGSCGDKVLNEINAKHKQIAFWSNGVDKPILSDEKIKNLELLHKSNNEFLFVSVSRLDDHKRVDRCITFINELVNASPQLNFKYLIVGEGAKRKSFEKMVEELGLEKKICFIGAVNQSDIGYYLYIADVFISMYESSNVGNPLLEAIRSNKIILTLNNGDTGSWITHMKTGLIYNVNDQEDLQQSTYKKMSEDVLYLINNSEVVESIKHNLSQFSKTKLWTWTDRFKAEIEKVNSLIK
ncbi:MAG: glycosyltransferase [Pedobacter sp.]|nr:MAG: glycosyltransferase [Pedobacter sp.]